MNKKTLLSTILLLFMVVVYSCKKKNSSTEAISDPIDQKVLDAVKNIGFSPQGVIKRTGGYIVEGDIFIPEADLAKKMKDVVMQVGKTEQYRTAELVTNLPRVLKIYVSGLGSGYTEAASNAISRFNGVGTGLTFSLTGTASNADIIIEGYYEVSGVNGFSGFPSGGNPYPRIYLNTFRFSQNNAGWAASIILHEMGHAVGLRHTDYMNRSYSCYEGGSENTNNAIHIPGTPTGPSAESFMLACNPDNVSRSISYSDVFALSYLYTPGGYPNHQAFFEFYNAATKDHSNWIEANIQNLYPGYAYTGYTHRVYPGNNVSGTVPLYRFYNSSDGDHVYSTDINILNGNPGWVNEGVSCYVFPTQAPGTVPVYRYWSSAQTDHIVTTDANASNYPGYVSQGIVYYAMPK